MLRINTPNRQLNKFGAGKDGFQDGDPSSGIDATYLIAAWCDALQEEIANAIENDGTALDPADRTQLITRLIARFAPNGRPGHVYTANDWTPIGGGLIWQWGKATTSVTSTFQSSAVLVFPTSFSAVPFSITGSLSKSPTSNSAWSLGVWFDEATLSPGGVTARVDTGGISGQSIAATSFFWDAIGKA